jgi:hypothetical protein
MSRCGSALISDSDGVLPERRVGLTTLERVPLGLYWNELMEASEDGP